MAEEKRISVEMLGPDDTPALTIFSITGDKRSKADFEKAYAEYEKTGKDPNGFIIRPPGFTTALRSMFEGIRQPVQSALTSVGKTVGQDIAPSGYAALAQHLGLVKPGTAEAINTAGGNVGEAAGRMIGSSIATPETAGMTVGMALASPFLGPVSAIGAGGQVAARPIAGILGNAIKTGVGGALGGTLAPAAMGESPDFARTATDFLVAGTAGGMQGIISHFITKMVKPNMHQQVAGDILDTIKKQYPSVANDPHILDIYASNSDNLSKLTAQMSQALKGENEAITTQTYDSIINTLKRDLTVGQQNTLRKVVRDYIRSGTELLDNIGDDKAASVANNAFLTNRQAIMTYLSDIFPAGKQGLLTPARQKTQDTIATTLLQYEKSLETYTQGAEVLGLLRQSGAEKGFNPNAFAETIKGIYQRRGNPLLQQVGTALGQGESLAQVPTDQSSFMARTAFDFVKNRIPFVKHIPLGDGPRVSSPLSWQRPKSGIAEIVAGQQAGLAAMQDFFGRKREQ